MILAACTYVDDDIVPCLTSFFIVFDFDGYSMGLEHDLWFGFSPLIVLILIVVYLCIHLWTPDNTR